MYLIWNNCFPNDFTPLHVVDRFKVHARCSRHHYFFSQRLPDIFTVKGA